MATNELIVEWRVIGEKKWRKTTLPILQANTQKMLDLQEELTGLRTALSEIKRGVKYKFIPLTSAEMRKIAAFALDKVK